MTHICVSELTIIGSDNGLSPGRRQAIIWNNAGLLLIAPLGTNFSEISIVIQIFSFKKMHVNMSSAKWRPFCLGLNVLTHQSLLMPYSIIDLGQHCDYIESIWLRLHRCDCLVNWFCYQLIPKPGNKTAIPPWPDPYLSTTKITHGLLTTIRTLGRYW